MSTAAVRPPSLPAQQPTATTDSSGPHRTDGEPLHGDRLDGERLDRATEFVRRHDTPDALAALLPRLADRDLTALGGRLRLAHTAVLVFPRSLDALRADLAARGLAAGEPVPSVVVRGRLARRYGLPADGLRVDILHVPVPGARSATGSAAGEPPLEVEVFALAVPDGSAELAAVAAGERDRDQEAHTAFDVRDPDAVVLAGLGAVLALRAGAVPDGGGYNAHENASVFYFRTDCHRLELYAAGHHPEALAAHLDRSATTAAAAPLGTPAGRPAGTPVGPHADVPADAPGDTPDAAPADRLLRLLTGAWQTQAIALAAELTLADHLDRQPGATAEQLAGPTGTHPDSLDRLLRYLAALGLVTRDRAGGHRLTATGRLLRTGEPASFHPLALLYGGPFYRSFGALGQAVRTGREAFAELFGEHHFAHFARDAESADLFDRAMAASARMFAPIAEVVDFSAARVVVDVAGGNGALLASLLRAAPHLDGVLLERPHAIEAARTALGAAGLAGRCRFVAGDFTAAVPSGGDVYVLSRVLHDWDDARCLEILGRCAEAMEPGAELLLVERLLPEDGTPSLAVAWDVHMLCNVGGRERTEAHYAKLLAAAGFGLTDRRDLPLDGALLRARRH